MGYAIANPSLLVNLYVTLRFMRYAALSHPKFSSSYS